MNSEEVKLLFASQFDVFYPILGQPTDADLMQLREELAMILLPLLYDADKGIQHLMVLVMDEEDYELQFCAKFSTPTNPVVYNETVPNNATNVVRAKSKAIHT